VTGVVNVKKRKLQRQVPLWLRRLGLVKAELKGMSFPRNAQEGFRQAAALSAISLRLLKAQVRSELTRANRGADEIAMRRLLARFSRADARWIRVWQRERARCFKQ
jgi:hypothetical protein